MKKQKMRKRMLPLLVALLLACSVFLAACATSENAKNEAKKYLAEHFPYNMAFTAPKTELITGETMATSYSFDEHVVKDRSIIVGTRSITYSSSDTTVATVDASGTVEAVAPGTATITLSHTATYSTTYEYTKTCNRPTETCSPGDDETEQETTSSVFIYSATLKITVAGDAATGNPEATLAVAQPPAKTVYSVGDALDLAGTVLLYTDEEGKETKISFADFEAGGVAASPAHGAVLDTGGNVKITFTHAASGLAAAATVKVEAAAQSVPPALSASLHSVGETTASFSLSASEHCTISMMIMPTGTATPTPENFNNLAQNAVYHTVYGNSQNIISNASGLAPGTDYVAFFRPVNAGGLWANEVSRVDFTTQRTQAPAESEPPPAPQPPAWLGGLPTAAPGFSPGFISLAFGTDVDATVYCLILPASDPAPSIETIISSGESWACQAGVTGTSDLNYTSNTSYIVYFVAVSSAGVAQQAYTVRTVTTGT